MHTINPLLRKQGRQSCPYGNDSKQVAYAMTTIADRGDNQQSED